MGNRDRRRRLEDNKLYKILQGKRERERQREGRGQPLEERMEHNLTTTEQALIHRGVCFHLMIIVIEVIAEREGAENPTSLLIPLSNLPFRLI